MKVEDMFALNDCDVMDCKMLQNDLTQACRHIGTTT
jgi:hypothetical protein